MKTHTGRGVGNILEKELFYATKYAFVCSPFISPSYAKRLVQLVENGIQVRVITTDENYKDKNGDNTRIVFKDAVKPSTNFLGRTKKDWVRPPLDYKIIKRDFVHAKIYVVDGKVAMVGSPNLTYSGLWNNIEHLMFTHDSSEVRMIEDDYEKLWNSYGGNETVDEHVTIADQIWKKLRKNMF